MFEIYTGIENGLVLKNQVHDIGVSGLLKRAQDRKKDVIVKQYSADALPKHLSNPDFYFRKFEQAIDMENIKAESDSEKTQPEPTVEEVDEQLKNQVDIKIKNLNTYLDLMNETLEEIEGALKKDLKSTVQYFKRVNKNSQK